MESKRVVSRARAEQFATEVGGILCETSAKENWGVTELFSKVRLHSYFLELGAARTGTGIIEDFIVLLLNFYSDRHHFFFTAVDDTTGGGSCQGRAGHHLSTPEMSRFWSASVTPNVCVQCRPIFCRCRGPRDPSATRFCTPVYEKLVIKLLFFSWSSHCFDAIQHLWCP